MTNEIKINQEEQTQATALANLMGVGATEMVNRATDYATTLATVISSRGLVTVISGKKHVNIEGWNVLGTLLGVMPVVEWSRRCEGANEQDWAYEARAKLVTLDGRIVASGESMASKSENKPWSNNLYSIRGMAETRAIGRCYRQSFAWIMKLAGYEGLPAEEAENIRPVSSEDVNREKEYNRVLRHIIDVQTVEELKGVEEQAIEYGLSQQYQDKLDLLEKDKNGKS